jgi:hypothetical protein
LLAVARSVIVDTFMALRACGRGTAECVALWTGPIDVDELADTVIQPRHHATSVGYELEDEWITAMFVRLRSEQRTVRAQIHTHPGRNVGHSLIDEAFPLIRTAGFVSIVVPRFATGPIDLRGAGVFVIDQHGEWVRRRPHEIISTC